MVQELNGRFSGAPAIKCETCKIQTHFYFLLALMALIKADVLKIKNSLDKRMSKTAIMHELARCSSLLETLVSKWP